jgi:hypothetical protein
MPYIVVIDKMGAVKETNIKEYKESDLFKKAGFKSVEGFVLQHIWQNSDSAPKSALNPAPNSEEIAVYAKKNGKAGQENKYEFPPPIDSVLFFGSCVLIKIQNGAVVDFRLTEWNRIYDKLMGGFEDLGSVDDEEEDEDAEAEELLANGAKLGKEGYILDDFIVEDEREEEDYDAFSESSKSEKEIEKKKKKKTVKKPSDKDKVSSKKKEKTTNIIVAPLVEEQKEEMYLDCEMELVEEAYV